LRAGYAYVPTANSSPAGLRLTMSMFTFMMIESRGTGGLATNARAPCRPASSASNATKMIEFRGG
jgi:hypothetical protein